MGHKQSQNLRLLVAELIKQELDHAKIRALADSTGVAYAEDPLDLMTRVLHSIDKLSQRQKVKTKSVPVPPLHKRKTDETNP
ncbi:MAG: hypothetical protein C5B49_10375 [Bdellovibrio sp.]|nr:MAG: hypothetical protein C5B49_10375 [Bdellovibrio sp.]